MKKQWQKKLIYMVMVTGLVWMYVTYVPFLVDYYFCRPTMSFFRFFEQNLTNAVYDFEGALLALVIVFVFCLTWNGGVSVMIVSLAIFLLTHGSYVKYMNRKEMLKLDDFRLTEAAGMAAGYFKFEFTRYLVVFVGGLLLFVAAGIGVEAVRRKWLFPARAKETKNRSETGKKFTYNKEAVRVATVRILTAAFVAFVMVFCTQQFVLSRVTPANGNRVGLVDKDADRYVLYRFVENERLAPASQEQTEESYDFLLAQSEGREVEEETVYPNVIVIMNESWWNTDYVDKEKVSFSMNPMGPCKRLLTRCETGYLTSNVYGGGTISSEAEFLTGLNTKYYVTSSTIYEMTKDRKLPSVVDYFNALDYETVAVHPYYGAFYNRDEVYGTMGFDEVIFEEDMKHRDIYTRYISDDSLMQEIIAKYEEQGDAPNKFIWAVSVSNHRRTLNYHIDSVDDYDYPISVELEDDLEQEDMDTLVNYVNGIYYAARAYEQLVNYFAKKEEPVILVMYGDHIPNFSLETRVALGLSDEEVVSVWRSSMENAGFAEDVSEGDASGDFGAAKGESFEDLKKLYSVPIIMWSNFELESEPEFEGESIYYLSQMILESAGLPDSKMSRMLKHQRSVFRANAREYVLDENGEQLLECTEAQMETLNHMKTVTYDILFGDTIEENVWLPNVIE